MAIDSLTATLQCNLKWTASKNITGRQPYVQSDTLNKSQANGTANANNTSGGANELISYNLTVAANTSTTVDVTSITDILQQSVNIARIKGFQISLLSYTDDPTLGTNCTSITVGNAATNQMNLNLGTNSTMTVDNGATVAYTSPKALGIVCGVSARNIKIANDDITNAATVQISLIGANN